MRLPRFVAAAAIALGFGLPHAHAQTFPHRPIKLVVPFPAGSASDQISRLVGKEMEKDLGQPIFIENKAGAQTIIAMQYALQAPSDGHTIVLFGSSSAAINLSMFRKLPYDPLRDFTPIGQFAEAGFVLAVTPRIETKSTSDLIRYAKANPGKLNCGYGSTSSQVACEVLALRSASKITHVSYKGTPQALMDLLAGTIELTFIDVPNALPHVQSGKLKMLAVSSRERSELTPGLPAVAEELPGFDVKVFFGFAAPGQLPPQIGARLYQALEKAMTNDELVKQLTVKGYVVRLKNGPQFTALIKREIDNWATMIKDAGIKPQD